MKRVMTEKHQKRVDQLKRYSTIWGMIAVTAFVVTMFVTTGYVTNNDIGIENTIPMTTMLGLLVVGGLITIISAKISEHCDDEVKAAYRRYYRRSEPSSEDEDVA